MTVDPGTWSGTPGDLDYSWLRCEPAGSPCQPIADANDQNYVVQRTDAGSVLRALVTMTNDWGGVSVRSDASDDVPDPPAVSSLMAPSVGISWWNKPTYDTAVTSATHGTWVGSPQTINDQWQRCDPLDIDPETDEMSCADIPDATHLDSYIPVAEDVGFALRLKETASSDGEEPVISYSDPTADLVAIDATTSPVITGLPASGQTFTADAGANNLAHLPTTITYKFERGTPDLANVVVQDGDSPTYGLTDDDIGFRFAVTMTVTVWRADSGAPVSVTNTYAYSDDVRAALGNDAPPTISGDLTAGAVQSADPGTWHGGGGELRFTYSWQRCDEGGTGCTGIAGADQQAYTSTMADVGHELRALVTAVPGDQDAAAVTVASAPVGPLVVGDAPVNVDPPTITGTAAVRETLTADPGSWSGSDPITYTYQWQRCAADGEDCTDLKHADVQAYSPTGEDVEQTLRVIVTAHNAMGQSTAAAEATDTVGDGAAPGSTALPSITMLGTDGPGSTLVTDGGRWTGADSADLTFSWQRCDWIGASCETIPDAVANSYTLTTADEGHRLQVTVSAGNTAGSGQVTSDLTDTIGSATTTAANQIVFLGEHRADVRMAASDGSNERVVTTCAELTGDDCGLLYRPRISPNLKMIAVEVRGLSYTEDGDGDIYLLNIDGSGARHLVKGSDPAWSLDGTKILYTASDDGGRTTRAQVVGADGLHTDEPRRLDPDAPRSQSSPDAANDGTIVYTGREDGFGKPGSIYLHRTRASQDTEVPLSSEIASAVAPQFSADGTAITFQAVSRDDWDDSQYGRTSIWKVNRDGSALTRISPNTDDTYLPATAGTDTIIYTAGGYECVSGSGGGEIGGRCAPVYSSGTVWSSHIDGSDPQPLAISHAYDASPAPTGTDQGRGCGFEVNASKNEDRQQDAIHHKAKNWAVGFDLDPAACSFGLTALFQSGQLRVTQASTGRVMFTGDVQYTPHPGDRILHLRWPCTPTMDGLQNYEVKIVVSDGGEAWDVALNRPEPLKPARPSTRTVHLRCPTTTERQTFEYRAWKALGRYNPKTRRLLRDAPNVSARILGQNISNLQPFNPGGAWDAHHLIPWGDPAGELRLVQAGAFRCGMYPNDVRNGVWLRNAGYWNGRSAYTQLHAPDNEREWHPLTYYGRFKHGYFDRLRDDLVGHGIDSRKGTCTSRTALRAALAEVRDRLIEGTYLPNSWEDDYVPGS